MTAKPMSAAAYRQHAEKKRSQLATEIVTLKSGSVFELRRPDLSAYMVTGRLPQSLVQTGLAAWKRGAEAVAQDLDDQKAADAFIFMREVVHEATVNPKFVQYATNDNEISAADMMIEDFNEIFTWAMGYHGVAGLPGLQTFREGSERGTTGNSVDSKELGSESEQPVETPESVQ